MNPSNGQTSWLQNLRAYKNPRAVALLCLGFSSGLPILLVFGTFSFWLREAGVARSSIGFISWVALAYGFKWLWSPLVDRLSVPLLTRWLGRRRAWLLLTQVILLLLILSMALTDPLLNLELLVWLALLTAFFSATQDIVIDAYRIESSDERLQGVLASTYMIGYRIAMIFASAGVLWIAAYFDPDESSYQRLPWTMAYGCMALLMGVGILTTLLIAEPEKPVDQAVQQREAENAQKVAHWRFLPPCVQRFVVRFWNAVINPFVDFIVRYRWQALLILALIASYRMADIVLGVMANVFYVDMGFSKQEVANVTKVFGIIMTLLGAVLGGLLVNRYRVMPILFLGALLTASTNLLFALLAGMGNNINMLMLVVSVDNLSAGLATAAFVAYLSSLTNISYSATQYALFSSMMLLLPKFMGGFSGVLVDEVNYQVFFLITAALGLPALLLVWLAARWVPEPKIKREAL
ncbi:MAG: MFS transporter [Gammaproteobacteria bacterium]|nr:MFS transporter [Gammaproteobacteria bacterium]